MLPQIFANNFRNPINLVTSPRRWNSPFISSLSFKDNSWSEYNSTCNMELVSGSQFGEDTIYVLPQLPSITHTREINYSVRVPEVVPGDNDIYINGIFTNSLKMNLRNFNKWEFLYTPLRFMEHFHRANASCAHEICISVHGHVVHQPTRIEPAAVKGTLYLLPQKYPSETQAKKQKHMCYRTCIFK